jgi:hypothetical protein
MFIPDPRYSKKKRVGGILSYRFKGRWKRETMGVRKEPNVRLWSRAVAIEVYLQFEHAAFQ